MELLNALPSTFSYRDSTWRHPSLAVSLALYLPPLTRRRQRPAFAPSLSYANQHGPHCSAAVRWGEMTADGAAEWQTRRYLAKAARKTQRSAFHAGLRCSRPPFPPSFPSPSLLSPPNSDHQKKAFLFFSSPSRCSASLRRPPVSKSLVWIVDADAAAAAATGRE